MPRTPAEAEAWGRAQITRPSQSWTRLCLSFVRQAFGLDYVGSWPNDDRNAGTAWDRATRKHRETNPAKIPARVAAFFETPGAADHVVFTLGGGLCLTNDFVRPGKIDVAKISDIAAKWGPLLGWTEDLVGNRLPGATEPTKPPAPAEPLQFLVDVHPTYQRGFDFKRAVREGVRGFIIKLTEGSTVDYGDDFAKMWKAAQAAAPDYLAVYHWVRQSSSARDQLANVRRHLPAGNPDVWLDVEKGTGNDLPKKERLAEVVRAFRGDDLTVPGAYIPRWYWRDYMGSPNLADLKLLHWNSAYGSNVNEPKRAAYAANADAADWAAYGGRGPALLQFGSRVQVAGWAKGLDCNAFRGTRAELRDLLGVKPKPTKPPTERPPNPGPDDEPTKPTTPPGEEAEYITVKLRTYNCGGKERGQGMVKVLTGARDGATDDDWVIAWQEVGDQDDALEQIDALPGVDEVRGPKGLGRAKCALSVPDGAVRDEGLYDLTDRTKVGKPGAGGIFTDHKYVTWAKADLGPVTINVASIHYISSVQGKDTDWREKRRELHAEQVGGTIEWAKTRAGHGPVFVLGDTNTTPDSALLDAFRAANWTIHGTGSHGGANEDKRAIDLLLVPPHQRVEVVNVRSLPGFGSDHRPVEYTVRIQVNS